MNKLEKIKKAKATVEAPEPENKPAAEAESLGEDINGVVADTTVKAEVDAKIESSKGGEVRFKLRSGQIRVFSEAEHGSDYKEVAEAFKNNGKKLVAEVL